MKNPNYKPSWNPSQNDFYEPDVNTNQPGTNASKWDNRISFVKNNKLFVFASLFGTFSFAAILVGLSVGLSTTTTSTTTTTAITTSTPKPLRDWVFVISTDYFVKAPLLVNGFNQSKAEVQKQTNMV